MEEKVIKKIKIGNSIIPETEHFEEFKKYLEKYGITACFDFESGSVEFSYPDSLSAKTVPPDISFYDYKSDRILTVIENFGALEFYGIDENKPEFSLEIFDDSGIEW